MSNPFNKSNIRVASTRNHKFDLSHKVITTQDFGHNKLLSCVEMVPNDSFHLNLSAFTRLAPLAVPTYGNVKMVNRCFFVPYRILMAGDSFNKFLVGEKTANSSALITPSIPFITNVQLQGVFNDDGFSEAASGSEYDFNLGTNRVFTINGRKFYDLLISLGYSINFSSADTTKFSALPLLAYFKVYRDYFCPAQYQSSLDSYLDEFFQSTGGQLNLTNVVSFVRTMTQAMYEPDFFTSAWQSQNRPDISNTSDYISAPTNSSVISGVSSGGSTSLNNEFGTTLKSATLANGFATLSQYTIEYAQKLASFARRNNIVGSRWFDQQLARFGVRPNNLVIDRSEYLGSDTMNIQISDVMATAAGSDGSNTSVVGDYAGKGIGLSHGSFNYETKEFGLFMVFSTIYPSIGYYQGRKPHVLHTDRFDFYTPEFDSVGVEAIRNDQLFADFLHGADFDDVQDTFAPGGIFGYCPRYASQKFCTDIVSGDYRVRTLNTGLDSYHLERVLPTPTTDDLPVCNAAFSYMSDWSNYDRIFSTVDENGVPFDHFYSIFNLNLIAERNMHPVVDNLDIDGDGSPISIATNGTQL